MSEGVDAADGRVTPSSSRGPSTARGRIWAYIALLVVVAAALAVLGLATQERPKLTPLIVLSCMAVLGSSIPEESAGSSVLISFNMIILAAAVALVGPAGAVVVGTVAALFAWGHRRAEVRVFNSIMGGVLGGVGGFVYLLTGGLLPVQESEGPTSLLLRVGAPLMCAVVAMSVVNALLLGGVIRLSTGARVVRFAARMLTTSGPAYVGYGLVGFLFVVLWNPGGVKVFSAVLVLAPLFVARWAFGQYGDEQRVHERTVSALVAAAQANDPYTRGHSERMATLCGLIAEQRSFGFQRSEALRFAALLHDVGTISLPWQTLRKSGPLTDSDLEEITKHPAVGLAMVEDIAFLHESSVGILHHHERFDGRGYPSGLAGEDIPELARVIAVADAFDSMTTSRSYRPAMSVAQALAELRARAGSQFDPDIVESLAAALEGHEWDLTVLSPAVLATAGDAHDHDDPVVSDLIAARAPRTERSQALGHQEHR